jgi:hypothetical protein
MTVQLAAGITDLTGAGIAAQSPTFTTMAGADFSAPYVIQQSIDGDNNQGVPTNVSFTWVFNKPLDPTTVVNNTNGFYVYDSACTPTCYPPVTTHVSADGRTVTIVPNANLTPSQTNDHFYAYNATDLNGNVETNTQQGFTTAATTNFTGPTIVATNPLSTNTNPVPINSAIEVIFSAPVSATSLGSITLTGGANGAYTTVLNNGIYTNDTVVRIIPQQLLLPNTTYTVNVTGVKDVAGNAASTTTFAFTTGPNFQTAGITENLDTATVTTGTGTVPLVGGNSTNVPNVLDSPTFTITYDHAIDYATLLHGAVSLRDINYNVVTNVTLNYVLSADQKTVTITTSGLAPATTYRLTSGYNSYVYDISGNSDAGSGNNIFVFTTQ